MDWSLNPFLARQSMKKVLEARSAEMNDSALLRSQLSAQIKDHNQSIARKSKSVAMNLLLFLERQSLHLFVFSYVFSFCYFRDSRSHSMGSINLLDRSPLTSFPRYFSTLCVSDDNVYFKLIILPLFAS